MNPKRKTADKVLSESGFDITPLGGQERDRLAESLTPEQFHILLEQGTEAPFCGSLLDNKETGTYACRLCGLPLFHSSAKFTSGTGWASFSKPVDRDHIRHVRDAKFGMIRTETRCARCDGHQGHVFEDGPPPNGERYCINSESLEFFAESSEIPQRTED